ncbi:MAG: hypothetical protein CEN89_301 [Candidatus Berkelbacteria bacterium Licking1014_7]|uniref:EamA domain-containing protein n=1 Tax=Candidatus Berkelbacteria bacterium Licking1014_7 TaxID=2017147 RepID=A0A554LJM2_9BACT|nr:MAG: hypothetical protein CEN89_301 [Candidatus Berkelbacteria bacterium Licking1014_7]
MFYLIFLAVAADISAVIISKWTLAKQKLTCNYFNTLIFWSLAGFSALSLYWFGYLDAAEATGLKFLLLFGAMVTLAVWWNWLNTQALWREELDHYELIVMTAPLFTVVASALFLPEEREVKHLLAAIAVSVVLILTHIKKQHFNFSQYDKWLLVAVILIALEAVVVKSLLAVWSPAALYFSRALLVAITFTAIKPVKFSNISKKQWGGVLGVGLFGALFKIIQYVGYDKLGVVSTTMILVLSPFLVLILDKIVLREKLQIKYIFGMLAIGAIIVFTFV